MNDIILDIILGLCALIWWRVMAIHAWQRDVELALCRLADKIDGLNRKETP